jgi:uncharacterized protein (DUF952 family)
MRPTFHLVPADAWDAAHPTRPYEATSLAAEGFIHCTDGEVELLATANRHYRADPRPFLVLTVDLDQAGSPWTIEDERGIYPHIHGPIERAAMISVAMLDREPDGTFTRVGATRS